MCLSLRSVDSWGRGVVKKGSRHILMLAHAEGGSKFRAWEKDRSITNVGQGKEFCQDWCVGTNS